MVSSDPPRGSALWRAALTQPEPHPTFSPLGGSSLTLTPRDPRHCWASALTGEQPGVGMSRDRTCGITPERSRLTVLGCFGGCFGSGCRSSWGQGVTGSGMRSASTAGDTRASLRHHLTWNADPGHQTGHANTRHAHSRHTHSRNTNAGHANTGHANTGHKSCSFREVQGCVRGADSTAGIPLTSTAPGCPHFSCVPTPLLPPWDSRW